MSELLEKILSQDNVNQAYKRVKANKGAFDNLPQDKLMSYVHSIVNDGDTESLIRRYLKAGVR